MVCGLSPRNSAENKCKLVLLLFIAAFLLIVSPLYSGYIDKVLIADASYVFRNLPYTFYLGFAIVNVLLVVFIYIAIKHGHVYPFLFTFAIMLYMLYLEYPRLLYPNAFQIEYFHQAQIYHALNYGMVTDPGYSFPRSDVAHAIWTASLIMLTDMPKDFSVSYVAPILVRLALIVIACSMVLKYSENISNHFACVLILALPLYILISDTEPLFINHYSYALPLYLLLLYVVSRRDLNLEHRLVSHFILLVFIVASITITHIYFAATTILAFLAILFFRILRGNKAPVFQLYILSAIIYSIWHGMASS
ncbi:MAG: hypothetical protein B7O98_08935 [Zestosphaera tikiterensis]|uniref:Uncharacterized protein n=1 Tax=Zestosphaera tikiterensis TaxID=1973259 RepID=A0A2R7Y2C4_9CREN|nr:MAG: hypothetical protein B7O98_08935 [Zestosphaera tikiterensis]